MIPKIIFLNKDANSRNALTKWRAFNSDNNLISPDDIVYDSLSNSIELVKQIHKLINSHLKLGHTNFIAAGGDGTVNCVINAIALLSKEDQSLITLGAIGLGSSNDFHKPITSSLKTKVGTIPYRLNFTSSSLNDLCIAKYNSTTNYFLINAGLGVTAKGNEFFSRNTLVLKYAKAIHIDAAVFYASVIGFIKSKNHPMQVTYTNQFGTIIEQSLNISNFGIIKNKYFAGSLRYPTSPENDDGLFHLFGFHNLNRIEVIFRFFKLYLGILKKDKKVIIDKARTVTFRSSQIFPFEIDGEVFHTKEVLFKINSQGIKLCQ